MKHTLVARVKHQPGVLSRVSGLFRRRAFNIQTLTVGGSEKPDYARMTIVVDTLRTPAALVAANLRKLIPVVEVTDVTHMPTVEAVRESGRPVIIDFRVEPEESVYPMVPAGADLHAMIRRPAAAAVEVQGVPA